MTSIKHLAQKSLLPIAVMAALAGAATSVYLHFDNSRLAVQASGLQASLKESRDAASRLEKDAQKLRLQVDGAKGAAAEEVQSLKQSLAAFAKQAAVCARLNGDTDS